MRLWILPQFFGQISNGLPMAGVSKHAGVYFMWYSTRGTRVPSGVLFCKSFERVLHSSVPFHKYFEHPYLSANQLSSNMYIFSPTKIQMSNVGARVAMGHKVLKQRSPSGLRDETEILRAGYNVNCLVLPVSFTVPCFLS